MKKIISAALTTALCLTFAMLAGCASAPVEAPAPADTEPTEVVSSVDVGTETENDAEEIVEEVVDESYEELRIELSGDPSDEFVAEYNCFAEGENVVLLFQKGVTVKGDMIQIAESAMEDITEVSGLSFAKNYEPARGYCDEYELYDMSELSGVNADREKINLYVVDLQGINPYAIDNSLVVQSEDFYYDETFHQTLYHELAHVAHFRNGVSLSSTLSEGYAECIAYEALKRNEIPAWSMIQFFGNNDLFDEELVYAGQDSFVSVFGDTDANYQYGVRFMTFLFEEYGDGIFIDILATATARGYDAAYNPHDPYAHQIDTEALKTIIKEETSDDVFDRFADWYPEGWKLAKDGYEQYMSSIGLSW